MDTKNTSAAAALAVGMFASEAQAGTAAPMTDRAGLRPNAVVTREKLMPLFGAACVAASLAFVAYSGSVNTGPRGQVRTACGSTSGSEQGIPNRLVISAPEEGAATKCAPDAPTARTSTPSN